MKATVSLLLTAAAMAAAGRAGIGDWLASMTHVDEPTVVISPGYTVLVQGKAVPIWGEDVCPSLDHTPAVVFGGVPEPGSSRCIVLRKYQQTVSVDVGFKAGPVREIWEIRRRPDPPGTLSSLQRPDGELVRPLAHPI